MKALSIFRRIFSKHQHDYGDPFWKQGLLVRQCKCGLIDIVKDPELEVLDLKLKR